MKVSLNWLKDFVDIPMGIQDLSRLLTMAGLEVEGITPTGEGLEKVVVVQIDSIRKHPNADRLSLVQVHSEGEQFSIVCGASNIREGQKVPLALVGARLPNGLVIKKSKIRGEPSEGMLCSQIELGFGQDATGIMILPSQVPVGKDLGEALGLRDMVLDLSVTPNRPDWLSITGVAREIAALTHQKMKYPSSSLPSDGTEIHERTSVTLLDPDLCPRYVARMVEDVTVGPSPHWMKDRLEKVGVRPINNVVDVTNYVMMETGQPLHAFDFRMLEEGRIVVRRARDAEIFVSLDGVERVLTGQDLMICDGKKPVALAGVMGGLNSEIREDTAVVFLESAYFNPPGNRRTSKRLGLETEAAYRFGRGIDYGGCLQAADRATQLIQELARGRVIEGAIDAYPSPIPPRLIQLRLSKVNQILGTEIEEAQVKTCLEDLDLTVRKEEEGVLSVIPPSFRGDLEREVDLIEEVARMVGYEKIPTTLPSASSFTPGGNRNHDLERKAMSLLHHHGFYEVMTYSFVAPGCSDHLGLSSGDPRRTHLRILNPLSEDLSVMRTTLIPGLLEIARYNLSRKNSNIKIFELARVYHPKEGEKLPCEARHVAALATGWVEELHWASPPRTVDFHDLKGCIDALLEAFQIGGVAYLRTEGEPFLHPGRSARIMRGDDLLGVMGEVHPEVLKRYELTDRAYLFEMNFEGLLRYYEEKRRFQSLPKYPAVYRDLSLVVDASSESGAFTEALRFSQEPYLDDVVVFDVFQKPPIPKGKKSISYRIRYRADDRTLTDEEVNQIHERVTARLREVFQVEFRE